MKVDGIQEKVMVKAADPLAVALMQLYYMHSKTPMHRNKFFLFWDSVIVPGFKYTIPWFTVESQQSLDRIFKLEFKT